MKLISKIRHTDWIRIFLRSLYLQAALNYERMQGLGFASSMAPIIERVCKETSERKAFLRRHLEFFNAHPYFASFALGASVRLEETDGVDKESQVRMIKGRLCGPLGSLGDQLFWNALRPMVGFVGAIIALYGSLWGPILFLFAFNLPHLGIRYWGLKRGYDLGTDVSRELMRRIYRRAVMTIQLMGAIVVGLFMGTKAGSLAQVHINHLVLFLLFIILCWIALKRRLPLYFLIPVVLITGFIYSFIMHRIAT